MSPLKQPRVLQAPAVAVASGRQLQLPRDLGETRAVPRLFLPRGSWLCLPLAAVTPSVRSPPFQSLLGRQGNPQGLGGHRTKEWGEISKSEAGGTSLVLTLTPKIALCFHWVPAESQPHRHLPLVRDFPNFFS